MRIAVNTRFLLKSKMEGFGWYTYETFIRITRQHPEHTFIFLFDRPYDHQFVFSDNIIPVVIGPQARHPLLQWFWFNYSVTRALAKHNAGIFVSPDGYLSLRTQIPQIPVIHDINFEHHPGFLPRMARWYYRRYFPQFAKKASHIVTVSSFSRSDIATTYGIAPDKIDVVWNGASERFKPLPADEQQAYRNRITGGAPYFLFVGALHPRKNPECLLAAYDDFRKKTNISYRLLIVGEKFFWNSSAQSVYASMQHRNEVIFAGHMQPVDLVNAYGAARALVFPSYYEGFGIPLAEAMRCGTPVLSSNATCLPEVGGDAAAYFNPGEPLQLSAQMQKLATDDYLRNFMATRSLQRSSLFSWDQSANGLWKTIEKTARAKGIL